MRISEGRPIATPAYENGLLFVGGGYGSYEFYAFDAESGELAWEIKTADDGPTAAVVEDGYVAFNTESCTIMVLRARTGEVVWEEWLGDPLMSQPAICRDRIFMAYPADQRKPLFRPGMDIADKQKAIVEAKQSGNCGWRSGHEHRLLCADLTTGKHLWEQVISGDAITAPVINEGKVFVNCLDGISFCLDAEDGELVWKKEEGATSAPIVANGEVIYTEKRVDKGRSTACNIQVPGKSRSRPRLVIVMRFRRNPRSTELTSIFRLPDRWSDAFCASPPSALFIAAPFPNRFVQLLPLRRHWSSTTALRQVSKLSAFDRKRLKSGGQRLRVHANVARGKSNSP